MKNLLESFNPYAALFVSSLFFSLIHGANPNVTLLGLSNIFLAGIFLGASYVFTKNLWFPIALHFSWNFFQAMFGFKVSGLDSYSIIKFDIIENNYINGGEFGFGGEIGISTNKLPPRGPVGLNQLVSYKYEIYGSGQTRK